MDIETLIKKGNKKVTDVKIIPNASGSSIYVSVSSENNTIHGFDLDTNKTNSSEAKRILASLPGK